MPSKKPPPNHVLRLIAEAMKRKRDKEAKRPTLAQRFIPRKGRRG